MTTELMPTHQDLEQQSLQSDQSIAELIPTQHAVEEVALQFNPRTEVDDQGLTRLVFEYNGITFSFQGRTETPDFPTVENSRPSLLGHKSLWLSNSSNQAEHDRVEVFNTRLQKLYDANSDKPEHFLVEQSPLGVYALLEKLQPENPNWKKEREAVENNEYDEATLLLIDTITGINALTDARDNPPLGEAVVIAGILGDKNAQSLALAAAQKQSDEENAVIRRTQERTKEWGEKPIVKSAEAFKPEDLVAVHVTSFEPQKSEDGYLVQTIHDAIGFPRSTIHTALNHKVLGHMWGKWDDKGYVLIAGLDKMIERNGGPNSSNGADTWWTRNPGEKLEFPGGTLIAPGGAQEGLVIRDGSRISYKSEGITEDDIASQDPGTKNQIHDALNSEGKTISLASEEGQHIVADIIRDNLVFDEITVQRGKEWLIQYDDKFMNPNDSVRIDKMYLEQGITTLAALHNGGSDEGQVESEVGQGRRLTFRGIYDPKIRRVAYASGMMSGGGKNRQKYLDRENFTMVG